MKTTLREIRKHDPCIYGWNKLLAHLNKTKADNKPLDLMTILESNGIKDAVWALICFDYEDYCLFLADIAESVLPIFEKKYPDDNRPRKAIQAIRDYKLGKIDKTNLKSTAYVAADAADSAYTARDAHVVVNAAHAAAYAACAAHACAAHAAYNTACAITTDTDTDTHIEKWEKVEQLFIKHFGE